MKWNTSSSAILYRRMAVSHTFIISSIKQGHFYIITHYYISFPLFFPIYSLFLVNLISSSRKQMNNCWQSLGNNWSAQDNQLVTNNQYFQTILLIILFSFKWPHSLMQNYTILQKNWNWKNLYCIFMKRVNEIFMKRVNEIKVFEQLWQIKVIPW